MIVAYGFKEFEALDDKQITKVLAQNDIQVVIAKWNEQEAEIYRSIANVEVSTSRQNENGVREVNKLSIQVPPEEWDARIAVLKLRLQQITGSSVQ